MANKTTAERRWAEVTIAASGTNSTVFNSDGYLLAGFVVPASMTSTAITVQVSLDGSTFFTPKFESVAIPAVTITSSASAELVDVSKYAAFQFFRLVAGSSEAAARTLTMLAVKG